MKTVLFACIHNAGRSQMAAAFFNGLADPALARATSAGTEPAERVHPEVVAAMAELTRSGAGCATWWSPRAGETSGLPGRQPHQSRRKVPAQGAAFRRRARDLDECGATLLENQTI